MIKILVLSIIVAGSFVPSPMQAQAFTMQVGDRPYAHHGYRYWDRGTLYVWVPGRWTNRHHRRIWSHGYYAVKNGRRHDGQRRIPNRSNDYRREDNQEEDATAYRGYHGQ